MGWGVSILTGFHIVRWYPQTTLTVLKFIALIVWKCLLALAYANFVVRSVLGRGQAEIGYRLSVGSL